MSKTKDQKDGAKIIFEAARCYGFIIPKPKEGAPHRLEEWNVSKCAFKGSLKVISTEGKCTIAMEEQTTGKLYACAFLRHGEPNPVEQVLGGSSNYIALRVEENRGGRLLYDVIGIGFRHSRQASDLVDATRDHLQCVEKEKIAEEMEDKQRLQLKSGATNTVVSKGKAGISVASTANAATIQKSVDTNIASTSGTAATTRGSSSKKVAGAVVARGSADCHPLDCIASLMPEICSNCHSGVFEGCSLDEFIDWIDEYLTKENSPEDVNKMLLCLFDILRSWRGRRRFLTAIMIDRDPSECYDCCDLERLKELELKWQAAIERTSEILLNVTISVKGLHSLELAGDLLKDVGAARVRLRFETVLGEEDAGILINSALERGFQNFQVFHSLGEIVEGRFVPRSVLTAEAEMAQRQQQNQVDNRPASPPKNPWENHEFDTTYRQRKF